MPKIFTGTSGFSYKHWGGGTFYPENLTPNRWLQYYAQDFNTVELNVSFYRTPKESTYKKWRQETPRDFTFALKGSRFITHLRKLVADSFSLDRFLEPAGVLQEKLNIVLWQLPANFRANKERLENFCRLLKNHPMASKIRHSFEFRHPSWFAEEIYHVLRKYNSALCIAHSNRWPCQETTTADFVYLRFHGGQALYSSNYQALELKVWAEKCQAWLKQNLDIYAYFNNDAGGFAVENAKTLKTMLNLTS